MPRFVVVLLLTLSTLACVREPIVWDTEAVRLEPPPSGTRLVLGSAGRPAFDPKPRPPAPWSPQGACADLTRYARATERDWYAVAWIERDDGSARLDASHSTDGGYSWGPPVPVDTVDRGHLRCRRPPPGVFADSASGYLHVVYFLQGPEGPGVFFSHSMEHNTLFHEPVPIVYGERPSRASVAAWGDTVVVAYEEPNASRPQVRLALSETMGHIFVEWLGVSGRSVAALEPHVALRGARVAVAWTERGATGAVDQPAAVIVRTGYWR